MFKSINAKELAGLMTLVADFVFISFAIIVEPTGEIHSSILGLSGELLVFAGTCFGLDYFTHRANNKRKDNGQRQDNAE